LHNAERKGGLKTKSNYSCIKNPHKRRELYYDGSPSENYLLKQKRKS